MTYFDNISEEIDKFVNFQIERNEQILAHIIQNYDFIVGSIECKHRLMKILPEGVNIICSPYIENPIMIYAIKKFDINNLLVESQEDKLKQQLCDDAINREMVLNKIKEVCFSKKWAQFRVANGSNGQRDFIIDYIEKLSPVTLQTKTGHWIYIGNSEVNGLKIVECSACGKRTYGSSDYCPNCGVKMEDKV